MVTTRVEGSDFPTSLVTTITTGGPVVAGSLTSLSMTGSHATGSASVPTGTGTSAAQESGTGERFDLASVLGGIAGGLGAALLIGILACYRLRQCRARRRDADEDGEYHVFTDTSSSASHRLPSRRSTSGGGGGGGRRERRTTQESREAYDEKYGYMEELGPTPRQSRYSDGINLAMGTNSHFNVDRGFKTPSLIHLDTESVRSMGVRHIIDPKELGRSPSSPAGTSSAGGSMRGSTATLGLGGSGVGSGDGEKRGKWRSSISAFASPLFGSFFSAKPAASQGQADAQKDGQEEQYETLADLRRSDTLTSGKSGVSGTSGVSGDSRHSRRSVRQNEQPTGGGGDQRFTLTLPTTSAVVASSVGHDDTGSDSTHATQTTSSTAKAASRKSTATVKSVKSTKTGRSAATFGAEKHEELVRRKESERGHRQSHAREGSRDRAESRRLSRGTGAASPSTQESFDVPPIPTKRKSSASGTSASAHASASTSTSSHNDKRASTKSASSRASKHVSGLAGLPALQYVDYGDSDDIPSVPNLPTPPSQSAAVTILPASEAKQPITAAAVPFDEFGYFPAPPTKPTRPRVNTDVTSPKRMSYISPLSSKTARSIAGASYGRSRAESDATSRMTHEADADDLEDGSNDEPVTITARRVPVSAVGRVKSGIFERPRTLLMGSTSTTSFGTTVPPGDRTSCSSGSTAADEPDQGMGPSGPYQQPAFVRHSGLDMAGQASATSTERKSKVSGKMAGPRFSERWPGWTPISGTGDEGDSSSRDGHAV